MTRKKPKIPQLNQLPQTQKSGNWFDRIASPYLQEYEKLSEEDRNKLLSYSNQTTKRNTGIGSFDPQAINSINSLVKGLLGVEPTTGRNSGGGSFDPETVKTQNAQNSWFKAGGLSDGYELGDLTLSNWASTGDFLRHVGKGAFGVAEGVVDTVLYGMSEASGLAGDAASYFGLGKVEDVARFTDQKMKELAMEDSATKAFGGTGDWLDEMSYLGGKTDSVAEGVGQVATTALLAKFGGANGVNPTLLTSGTMFASSLGRGITEALNSGASDEEAWLYGLISGTADAATEMLFGGIGKGINALGFSRGITSLDDIVAKNITGKISNTLMKNIAQAGIKGSFEGLEEVLAGFAQAWGKSVTYLKDEVDSGKLDFWDIVKDENLFEQWITGALTSAISSAPSVSQATVKGQDYITGYTKNDQAVIDRVIKDLIAEAEAAGQKLTAKDKANIKAKVEEDLEKGHIPLDTIEEMLGGDKYTAYQDTIQQENNALAELAELYEGDELQQKAEEFMANSKRGEAAQALRDSVFDLVKDSRLGESYREVGRRTQKFEVDLNQYTDEKQRAIVQKAVESGVLNNTNRTHDMVNWVSGMAAKLDTNFEFTNNEKLKDSIFAVDGKTVDGYVTKDGIVINVNSPRYINTVVGHEITHVLEDSNLYDALESTMIEYAKEKGTYQDVMKAAYEMYHNVEGYQGADGLKKIKKEAVANMVGDYLFTDKNFINHLTKNQNVFQKVWNEIKYMVKISRAGSNEHKKLLEVQRAFEKAYREGATKANENNGKNVKYSLENSGKAKYNKRSRYSETETLFLSWANGSAPVGEVKQFARFGKIRYYEKTENGYVELSKQQFIERNKEYAENIDRRAERRFGTVADYDETSQRGSSGDYIGYQDTGGNAAVFGQTIREKLPDVTGGSESSSLRDNTGNADLNQSEYNEEASAEEQDASFITFSNDYAYFRNRMKEGDTGENGVQYSLSDSDYLDAVNRGDIETAQKMVDEAAKNAGYTPEHLFHGTSGFGFTKIDTNQSDDGISFFVADNVEVAQGYFPYFEDEDGEYHDSVRPIGKASDKPRSPLYTSMGVDEVVAKVKEAMPEMYADAKPASEEEVISYLNKTWIPITAKAATELKNYSIPKNVDSLVDSVIEASSDGSYEAWKSVADRYEEFADIYDIFYNGQYFAQASMLWEKVKSGIQMANKAFKPDAVYNDGKIVGKNVLVERYNDYLAGEGNGVYDLYANHDNQLVISGRGSNWNDIPLGEATKDFNDWWVNEEGHEPSLSGQRYRADTRSIAKYAKARGYKSVRFEDIYDAGAYGDRGEMSTVYAFFYPDEDIKSADAVTYDDGDNVIPLSERFNPENTDIRFSLFGEDTLPGNYGNYRVSGEEIAFDDMLPMAKTNAQTSQPVSQTVKEEDLPTVVKNMPVIQPPAQKIHISKLPMKGADSHWSDRMEQLQQEYGTLPEGENPVRDDSLPKSVTGKDKVSLTARTVKGAQATPDGLVELLDKNTVGGRFSYIPISNDETVQRAYSNIVKNGWEAARGEWSARVRRGEVSADLTAEGALLLNNAANAGDRKAWLSILGDYQLMGTNAGQAIQAMRILKTLQPEDSLYMIERSVEQMVEDMRIGSEITIDEGLKQAYLDAKTDEDKNAALDAITKNVAQQIPSSFVEKWTSLRYLNMLGNFRTQVRNIIGNAGMALTSKIKNAIATGLENIAYYASGKRFHKTKSLFVSNSLLKAARNDFVNVEDIALNGGKFNDPMARSTQFAQKVQDARRIFKFAPLEKYRQLTNYAMDKGDLVFSKAAYARILSGYLKANGITETDFSKIDQRVLDKARAYAVEQAQEQTFRDNNMLSDWISKIGRRKDTPKLGKLISEGVLPFRKTPANILLRAEEYSPLGIINTAVEAVKLARGIGDVTGADVVNSLSKTFTGTGLFLVGMLLNNAGILSGGPDEDDDREWFENQYGMQNYAIYVGDYNFTIDFFAPSAMPLLMGAQLNELRQEGDIQLDDLESALLSIADPMIEMSMLQGVNDTLDNIKYAESNMGQFLVNAAVSYLTQGLTNSFLGQLERSTEDQRMTTYVDKDSPIPVWLQNTLGKMSAKTPGWDFQQIPYINAWGETEDNDLLPSFLENTLSPSYINESNTSWLYDELNRLDDMQSDYNVYPQTPDKTITYRDKLGLLHEDYNLTAGQYTSLATIQGKKQKELVIDIISSKEYSQLTDTEKAKAISLAYQYAKEYGRQTVLNAEGFSSQWMEDAGDNIVDAIIAHTSDERTFAYDYPEKYAFLQEHGMTYADYKKLDEDSKDAYNWAFSNPEKYKFIRGFGLSATEYHALDKDSKDAYSWAYDNPEGYLLSTAVTDDVVEYRAIYKEINNFKGDNKKADIFQYISSLNLTKVQKAILFKSKYPSYDDYNPDIIKYINGRRDMSKQEKISVLKKLGFDVDKNGKISW